MKKSLLAGLLAVIFLSGCRESADLPMVVAHRGYWLMDGNEFYINENCLAGVKMAARYGYPAVEIDVKYTLDSVMVIMHDGTINRTMRLASDYGEIPEPVRVEDVAFDELRTKYVLESTDPALRTPIPTLKEELEACREYGVIPMLHSDVVESYALAAEMFGDGWIAFDGGVASKAREFSGCLVLVDPGTWPAGKTIEYLKSVGGRAGMSTMKYDMLDEDYISAVRDAGFEVQASIFPTPHEERAVRDGVSIQLSDFYWLPAKGVGKKAAFWKAAISDGGELSWTPDTGRFGDFIAYTLDVTYIGSLKIDLNGRKYDISRETPGTEHFGLRLYKDSPKVSIRSAGPASVKVRAEARAFGKND